MPVPAALAAGAMVVLVVAALAGASLDGQAWWAVVAGAFACASGMVLGSTRRAAPAVGLGMVAVVAVTVAAGASAGGRPPAPTVRHEIVRPAPPDQVRAPAVAPPANESDQRGGREALVRSYYAALDAHQYAVAWRRLSPSVQAAFGGFEAWRGGYATTVAHRVQDVRVDGDAVALVLVATDRTPCGGTTEQRFSVSWRLEGRTAVALTATKLGGLDPASACG